VSDDIQAVAAKLGVETCYTDALGTRRQVAGDDLRRIVEAITGHSPDAGRGSSVWVLRERETAFRSGLDGDGELAWVLESDAGPVGAGVSSDGWIRLDAPVRHGVYRLRAALAGDGPMRDRGVVVVTPGRAYRPVFLNGEHRVWVLAVQLYGMRSDRDWGHGDFGSLLRLVDIAADHGAAGIGLNPLHMLYPDRPEQCSPYAPNSRLFLNPLYIDVEAVPEYRDIPKPPSAEIHRLRAAPMIDYAGVGIAKMAALRACHAAFARGTDLARRRDFDAFRQEQGELLERFAAFETLRSRHGGPWWNWPEEMRRPQQEVLDSVRKEAGEDMDFHCFLQWIADRQLEACAARAAERGMPVGLYLDMAVGVEPGGFDVWCEQDAILQGLAIGAPPDILNPAGQNWGLASFNPDALARSGFHMLRETLRAVMRHAGAIRIDHVLGLNRFFLMPAHEDARHGAYVRFPLEAMLATIALESVRAECLVVGEDLGTVPEGFRERMAEWGVWGYRLMMFERRHDGAFIGSEHYPREALVAFNTHDLPTFQGWMTGRDFEVRAALGIDPGETPQDREQARAALRAALPDAEAQDENLFEAVVRFLARSPSGILAVAVEDVMGQVEQVNLPGTTTEHPNWRRRWPVTLERLAHAGALATLADVLRREARDYRDGRGLS